MKRGKKAPVDKMTAMTRPPLSSKKVARSTAVQSEQCVYTFGGKAVDDMFKAPSSSEPARQEKNNKELLADKGNTGREVSHLMN